MIGTGIELYGSARVKTREGGVAIIEDRGTSFSPLDRPAPGPSAAASGVDSRNPAAELRASSQIAACCERREAIAWVLGVTMAPVGGPPPMEDVIAAIWGTISVPEACMVLWRRCGCCC